MDSKCSWSVPVLIARLKKRTRCVTQGRVLATGAVMKSAQTGAGRQSDVLSIAWVENAIGRRPKLITDIMRDVGQALLLFGNRILRIAPLYSLTSFEAQEFSVYGPRGLGRCRPTAESLKKSRQVGNANEEGRWSRCDPSSVYVPRSIQVEYHLCYQVRDYTRLCAVRQSL